MIPAVLMHVAAGAVSLIVLSVYGYRCGGLLDAVVFVQIGSSLVIVFMIVFGRGLRLYPPRLRARLEIESICHSLCLALQTGASPQRLADRELFRRRFGLARATRDRMGRWEGQLRSDDADAWRSAAQEMMAFLAEPRRLGRPLGRPLLLPDRFLTATSVKIAVVGALLWADLSGRPLVDWATVIEAFVLFLASFMVSTMLRMLGDKLHDVRSKAGFRTIVITDQAALSWIGSFATWRLYARIGHAVVVFVRPTLDGEIDEPAARGLYTVVCTETGLADALAAFAAQADLVVLDTPNPELAARLRALTHLPNDRYRALSKDGSYPAGYRWVDPRTLMIDPADRRATRTGFDPYVRSTRRVRPWAADSYVFAAVASALLFAQVPHGLPLVLFFVAAGVLRIVPEQLGPRRVKAISRKTLRAPADPAASRSLHPRKLHRTLWIVTVAAVAVAITSLVVRTGLHPQIRIDPTIVVAAIAAWLALFGGHFIVAGLLILRKWRLDWNFRIIVLRRNSRVYGYGHKAYVMATCGKYGQVTSLHDDELDRTEEDYGEQRESALGSWFPIFSEIGQTLKPSLFFHTWQRQVSIELQVADFAVFDWVDDITDNMRWELAEALDHLPVWRILIVVKPENEADVSRFLDARLARPEARPSLLIAGRGRDDQYIWSSHLAFDQAFGGALHAALAALAPEPRPQPAAPIAGAWAYPCAADRDEIIAPQM